MLFEVGLGTAAYWYCLKLLAFDLGTLAALLAARRAQKHHVPGWKLFLRIFLVAMASLGFPEEIVILIAVAFILREIIWSVGGRVAVGSHP